MNARLFWQRLHYWRTADFIVKIVFVSNLSSVVSNRVEPLSERDWLFYICFNMHCLVAFVKRLEDLRSWRYCDFFTNSFIIQQSSKTALAWRLTFRGDLPMHYTFVKMKWDKQIHKHLRYRDQLGQDILLCGFGHACGEKSMRRFCFNLEIRIEKTMIF